MEKFLNNDKEVIVIEDYNSLFYFVIIIFFIPILILTYIYNPGGVSDNSLFRNIIIIIPLGMYPYINTYFKAKGKRKVVLTDKSIKFMHENKIIEEILLTEITEIKKTFNNIYHQSQTLKWFQLIGLYIVFPLIVISQELYNLLLVIPFFHTFVLIVKYILHKLKDNNYTYNFFDAIIVYSGERFINILPITSKEFEQVRNYFIDKDLGDIQNKKIYFELMGHSYENLIKGK